MSTPAANSRSAWGRVRRELGAGVASLHPGYFAMSMATGIVSLACHLLGLRAFAVPLFGLNLVLYAGLWGVSIARFVFYRQAFLADWASHQRAPGFFTSVAATCVVGTQCVMLGDAPTAGFALWIAGLALWVVCTYSVFVALSIKEDKPSLADGINGGWLVAVVATQSICVLGCQVLPARVENRDAALFFLTSLWLCGGMLYIWMISLIFYRYTFFRFLPTDLMPPYWINMGAVAISTLAGTALLAAAGDSPLMTQLRPFVAGFTILYWATASWWIPMLVVLGIWRHAVRRVRLAYDPLYWGLVFPLGMYSVCTFRLAGVFELSSLGWIARAFVVAALVAWLCTFSGLVTRLLQLALTVWSALRPSPAVAPRPQTAFPTLSPASVSSASPSTGGPQ